MSAQLPEWLSQGDQDYLRRSTGFQPWQPAAEATIAAGQGGRLGAAAGEGGSSSGGFGSSPWETAGIGALTGIGGALGSMLFGGDDGYGDIAPQLKDYLSKAVGYMDPYEKMGKGALGDYFAQLKQAEDPTQYIGSIMSKYQESPGAQFQRKQGLADISTGAAARGLLGSGAQARSMMKYGQGLSAQDQQQYLQNVLGLRGQTLGGLAGLGQMGEQAAGQMGQWTYGTGENLANLQSQMAAAQQKQQSQMFGDILGAAGSLALL